MESLEASQLQTDVLEAAEAGHEDIVARLLAPWLPVPRIGIKRLPCTWLRETAMTESLHSCLLSALSQVMQGTVMVEQPSTARLKMDTTRSWRDCSYNPALIDAVDPDNMTTLHSAALQGHESTVAQLLNHRPGLIDMKTTDNSTALHFAATRGHVKVVAQLLAFQPSVKRCERQ